MPSLKDNSQVIWITSYPKSGNTWMRFLLAHLLYKETETKSSKDIALLIPESALAAGQRMIMPPDGTVLLKTHYGGNTDIPLFKKTKGFIYIVRNPLDVMISRFHFDKLLQMQPGRKKDSEQEKLFLKLHIADFIEYKGTPVQKTNGGDTSWLENVESWLAAREKFPHVILRYEDLLNDTRAEMRRVLHFLRRDVTDQELNLAIEHSSFKSMKKMEEQEIKRQHAGFFFQKQLQQSYSLGHRFMRKGKSNLGVVDISKEQLQSFAETFGPMLEHLGYQMDPETGATKLLPFPFTGVQALPEEPALAIAEVLNRK